MRGGDDRQPEAAVPAGAPAEVGDLDHHRGAVLVTGVGKLLHPADDFVLVERDVVECRRTVTRHRRRARRHGQCDAALGALDVIRPIARLRHAVLRIGRLVGRRHEAVAQREVSQLIGLQQRIGGGHRDSPRMPIRTARSTRAADARYNFTTVLDPFTMTAQSLTPDAQAFRLMRAGRLAEALPLAERAVAGRAACSPAHGLLATILLRLGRTEDADAVVESAMRSAPGIAESYDALAYVSLALGRHERANPRAPARRSPAPAACAGAMPRPRSRTTPPSPTPRARHRCAGRSTAPRSGAGATTAHICCR